MSERNPDELAFIYFEVSPPCVIQAVYHLSSRLASGTYGRNRRSNRKHPLSRKHPHTKKHMHIFS